MRDPLRFLQAHFPGLGQFNVMGSDQGTEFTSDDTCEVLVSYGIFGEVSKPYCREHNGIIERMHRTIQERTRVLLFQAEFPSNMCGLAAKAVSYL